MYHSVLRSPGTKSDYIVSPDTIRADVAWLLSNGYTPVTLADVIAFADGEGTLPPKPVVLTFDDGYLNNAVYLPAIAAEFGVPMLLSAVGRFADDAETDPDRCPAYAMLRWSDYRALRDDGHFEIANHTYDMHRLSPRKGASRRPGESAADYRAALECDLRLMQARLADELGRPAQVFVYPFGALSPESEDVLCALGFRAALTCCDTANFITSGLAEHGEGGLLVLGRLNRAPGLSTEEYMRRLLRHYE
ncbi:MAG: polysaccharide deacetylase family protein [Clostridiales bacterium]|nr:polysaccharide deacetylase family protein [Clostridiales bacterium]